MSEGYNNVFRSSGGLNILLTYMEWPNDLQEELKTKNWNEM